MKQILVSLLVLGLALSFGACASSGSGSAATVAATPAPAAAATPIVLDNFEGQNFGGQWKVYDDVKDNKGSSKANPDPWQIQAGAGAKGTAHFGKCWGTVTTKFQYGFGGVGYDFFTADDSVADKDKKQFDLTAYKGIHFWFKGDGKNYTLSVKSPTVNTDFAYYTFTIEESSADWQEFTIDFSKFHQPSWGQASSRKTSFTKATGIQFQTVGQPLDKFEFAFDEFNLY